VQRQADILLASLRDFIGQPDYPTMVLSGSDASMVFPNRTLAALDRQDENTYYLLFPDPCVNAAGYMDGIARRLSTDVEVFNAELTARKLAPLPALPLELSDARHPPVRRLRRAIDYCAQHLPGQDPIVWGLLPGEIADVAGYRALIGPLLAPEKIEPWMDRHRFLVRDQPAQPFLVPELFAAKNDRVLVLDLDFSNEAFVQDLVEKAHDRRLPADERMNAFFQLGAVDFAFKRYAEALEKYGVCFNYFESKGNTAMQSLCLSGAADTVRQAGKPVEALKFYKQSLSVSAESQNLPLTQQGCMGAGSTCLDLSRDQEAEGYLKLASKVSGKLNNPFAKCDAMEKLGLAEWRLGKVQEAVETWVKAKDLAKESSYNERAISILNFLIALCRQSSLYHRVSEFEREKVALGGAPSAAQGSGLP
jgi:tetratricopeptide (TPR) repeat protein